MTNLPLIPQALDGPRSLQEHRADIDSASRPNSGPLFSAEAVVDEHFDLQDGATLEKCIANGDLTAVHHLIRYAWAKAVLQAQMPSSSRILDLGSGGGYGAASLAIAMPLTSVTGVDYDADAVASASRRYQRSNLRFRTANPMCWSDSIGHELWDAMTCFDVIEHVTHRELLLEGVVQHLAPDGLLLLSTPSGHPSNVLSPEWEHHRIEYCARSLYDLLRRYFEDVVGHDQARFPEAGVFDVLAKHDLPYVPTLNPVVCRRPIKVTNPYR